MRVQELAEIVSGRVVGDGETQIERIADLDYAREGEIAYVDNEKLFAAAAESKASCLIVSEDEREFSDRTLIVVANPKLAFSLIGAALHPPFRREPTIHPTAVVAETADIALTAYVGPHVCIGDHTHVGAYTRLEAGVVLGSNVTVGDNCVLHPNVVLYDGVSIGTRVILARGRVSRRGWFWLRASRSRLPEVSAGWNGNYRRRRRDRRAHLCGSRRARTHAHRPWH